MLVTSKKSTPEINTSDKLHKKKKKKRKFETEDVSEPGEKNTKAEEIENTNEQNNNIENTNKSDVLDNENMDNEKSTTEVNKSDELHIKRKKKRKFETEDVSEPGEKKTKKIESTNKKNNIENTNKSDASDDENMQEVKVSKGETNKYNGKFLRNSFNSSAGFSVLQKFITICNHQQNKNDLALDYLQAGGSLLEILRLLDTSEKKNIHNAATVFTAMHIVLMKILALYPQNQSSAAEACRHLINTHLASIHSMLSTQGKAKDRKIVLKLLAAVVSVGGTLPRELLNHLSLHSQLVDVLVSQSKPTDSQSVRTCFIHFILAFLIEGNASDIRALLEKRGVLSSIFSDLIYDYSDLVQLVLTTVKKYILENPGISKTLKLHLFSTPVVKAIVNLYNWKGPRNWPGPKKQKPLTENIDPEEKKITVDAVHEFLITLLTSNRYGIAFYDKSLGSDSSRHNQLINTILQSMDKAWEYDKPSELIVKILAACPDLIKSQLNYTEPFLVPRVSKKWIAVIQFIAKIINNIDVENCLKRAPTDMTTLQLANAILNLIVPSIVVKSAIIPSMEHSNLTIHNEIINLVLIMVKKAQDFILEFEKIKLDTTESIVFKNCLQEHIMKNLLSFESILKFWNIAISPQSEVQNCDIDEKDLHIEVPNHLLKILELLEAYNEICPEILLMANFSNSEVKPAILLTSLSIMEDVEEEILTIMKVKALKIVLSTSISDFSLNENIFSDALSFLIIKMGNGNSSLDLEIRKTLDILLNKCGIFEGYNDQIELWIESVNCLQSLENRLEFSDWIIKIIKRVSKNPEKYISLIHKAEENTGDEIIDVNRQEDIFNELSERNIEDLKFISSMLPVTSIPLLLCAAIENLKKCSSNTLTNYMSIILTHSLHFQISSHTFINLIAELKVPTHKYLISWSNNNSPVPIKKPFDTKNIFRIISNVLLNSSESYTIDVKEAQLCIEIDGTTKNYTLTSFELKALIRMTIFYLTQIIRKSNVNLENVSVYTTILLSLLKIANSIEIDANDLLKDCAKYIFKHPVLLQYFKGIYKSDNMTECVITTLLIKSLTLFFEIDKQSLILQFIHPYKEKFIMQIKSAVKKNKGSISKKDIKIYAELIKLLQLDVTTANDLLTEIMSLQKDKFLTLDKSTLSSWATVIPDLINRYSINKIENKSDSPIAIQNNLLKRILNYLIELKVPLKHEMDSWVNSLYEYFLKFPDSISAVDEKTYTMLLKINLQMNALKLLNLFTERKPTFITAFIKYVNTSEEILQQKCFIFSILSSSLKNKWDQEFLKKLYEYNKSDIIEFLTDPKTDETSWIRENKDAVAYLIDNSFDPKICNETCSIILSNGNKLDLVQEEHVYLYNHLFKKSVEINPDALKNFVQIILHIIVTSLKKDSKNIKKLNFLCETLINSINILKQKDNFIFEELNKNYSWPQFTRIILKSALKVTKDDKKETSFLLKALVAACSVAYTDNSVEEYVKTIFEMTTSHSEFMNVMLSNVYIKSDLVELLWILVRKNHSIMSLAHVPLYLASYKATLSSSDQYILKILQHYENNGIKLENYRPYLWGDAAASHYSVKGETDTALWRQPSTSQVFDLLVPEIVNNTIKNFPVKRNLNTELLNTIDSTESMDQVYDPAFYLPVFTHLLAENNLVACHKVIHSGALALSIMACSSTCEQIRLAGFTVISRFYFHLDATSSKEKLLWIHYIDTLRNGIVNTESPLGSIQLNGFVATFLARTCLVMTQPLDPLYSSLQAFLMAKPALDLNTIPEFLQLYHSSEIQYKAHRHWILEIIRDGLKTDNDMNVASKCVLFKMLFDFYISVLADKETKKLILEVVRSATKLSKLCIILVNGYALLPWLLAITKHINKGDTDSTTCILDIVNNILNIFHEKNKSNHYYLMLMKVRDNVMLK